MHRPGFSRLDYIVDARRFVLADPPHGAVDLYACTTCGTVTIDADRHACPRRALSDV